MNPAFLKGATWGAPGAAVDHIETHAAHVFLVEGFAYKVKKAVKLPYLDFSTLEQRRAVIAREFEINRALTPGIYLDVIEVAGEPVLKMRRFANADILTGKLTHGGCGDALARDLADMAVAAHRTAPRRDVPGADIMAGLGAQLSAAFTASPDIFRAAETLEFHALYEDALMRLKPLLNRRTGQSLVRRCHGDMHCNNLAVVDGKPILFDAIEFSEKIGTIDVLYDLAFLVMDLCRHDEPRAANMVLNRYLELRRAEEDLSGLAALPLFLSTRAGVRALVTADLVHELAVGQSLKPRGEALDYFRASLIYLKPPRPELICVGGLSGTGKTTQAARLAPHLGARPGAIHLRSDLERKYRAGVAETSRLPDGAYGIQQTAVVYEALLARGRAALAAGHAVIIDAVFARESERRAAASLARQARVPFTGLWLEAGSGTLKSRVTSRHGDASDADAAVVERQLGYDLGDIDWIRIDAEAGEEAVAARVTETVRRRSAVPA
jgi:aminoglycoside phosphotransferase family enzyme/predicted kinase